MKYTRFEDLPVWQAAIDLGVQIFAMTEDKTFRFKGDIANQIQRGGLSISNNIAEGFERGTSQELITFIYIARGSAGEVRSILCLLERIPAFSHLKSQISNLKSAAESISRQLRAWANSLQQGEIKGQRYLTPKSRDQFQRRKDANEFLAQLKNNHPIPGAKPSPKNDEHV